MNHATTDRPFAGIAQDRAADVAVDRRPDQDASTVEEVE